jgi:hypothetical protein
MPSPSLEESSGRTPVFQVEESSHGRDTCSAIVRVPCRVEFAHTVPALELVYDRCREIDKTIVWLRKVWGHFRMKLDGRDDRPGVGPLLRAADEIVWSCYRQVYLLAPVREPSIKQGPVPLTFIKPEYSPTAIPSDRPVSAVGLRPAGRGD